MLKYSQIKRLLDLFIAFFALILLSPIFLVVFLCLLFINNGKPFFCQERPGKDEQIFKIIKFKSMTDKKAPNGELLPNHLRVTKFGNFIRKYSLDEIPQLINILKGDMSLIGPRPLRVHYLPYYTKEESIRHSIRPGVTGLAQVSGRNSISWDKKLELDIKYVNNMSLINDIKIFSKTILKVFTTSKTELDIDIPDLDELRKNKPQ